MKVRPLGIFWQGRGDMKITGTNKESKCIYCGSTAFGRSCMYGPKKTHVHVDLTDRCIYCGSASFGPGCPFNPHGKNHQRGYSASPLALEAFEHGMIRGVLMKKLSEPIHETAAFKLGLIDDAGTILKEPETVIERSALTSADKYILRLRKLCEKNIDLLNTKLYFENVEEQSVDDIKAVYAKELNCRDDINNAMGALFDIVNKYSKEGVSSSLLEKILAESVLNVKEEHMAE